MDERLISEYAYRISKSKDLMDTKTLLKQFGEKICKSNVIPISSAIKIAKRKICCNGKTDGYRCADCGNVL